MIYIEKDTTNTFVLTLTEESTEANPVWLFKFIWETDLDASPVYWIGTDTSLYDYRYNYFTLVEGTDATFKIGQHIYEVYEAPEGSTPIDETGLKLIEEGRMVVEGTGTTIYD